MDIPNGYQPLYVAYPGDGSQFYFTAPSNYEARKFLEKEHPEMKSSFQTAMLIKSRGSYGFRNLYQLVCNTNILED